MGVTRSLGWFVVLGGLGALLWLTSREEPVQKPVDARALLGGRNLLDADRFSFRHEEPSLPLEFERSANGTWNIVEPVRDLASAAVLRSLSQAIDGARLMPGYRVEEITPKLLAECGLDHPRASFAVHYPDGTAIELALGLEGPLGDDVFVRRIEKGADGRIDRVSRALFNALQVRPHEAREPLVFANDATTVQRLRVTRRIAGAAALDVVELVRVGVSGWRIDKPTDLRSDPLAATTFVSTLVGLRADRFISGDPTAVEQSGPPAPDDAILEVDGGLGPETVTLRFDASSGGMIGHAAPRDLWFACDTRQLDQVITLPVRELRARWLLAMPIEDAQAIRITRPGDAVPFEILRDGLGQLRLARPVDALLDATASAEMIQALHSAAALDFVADDFGDGKTYGLGDQAMTVEIEGKARNREAILLGSDKDDTATFAARQGEKQVVTVPREVAVRLRRPWTDYVDRRVLSLESGALVGRIRRELPEGRAIEFVRGDDGAFRRGGSDGAVVDLDATLDALRELVSERALARDAAQAATSLGTLQLVAPSGQLLTNLELWRDADGRVLCALPRLAGVVFRLGARDSRDILALD